MSRVCEAFTMNIYFTVFVLLTNYQVNVEHVWPERCNSWPAMNWCMGYWKNDFSPYKSDQVGNPQSCTSISVDEPFSMNNTIAACLSHGVLKSSKRNWYVLPIIQIIIMSHISSLFDDLLIYSQQWVNPNKWFPYISHASSWFFKKKVALLLFE